MRYNGQENYIQRRVDSSIRWYVRYLFGLIRIDLHLNPDIISMLGVCFAAVGLAVSINIGTAEYGLVFFLCAFLLDYFDGYVALRNRFHSKISVKVDGVCDRLVELALIIFYYYFKNNIGVTLILALGYVFNILYLTEKQRYCIIQIRPYVVLSFLYSLMNKWYFALPALFISYALHWTYPKINKKVKNFIANESLYRTSLQSSLDKLDSMTDKLLNNNIVNKSFFKAIRIFIGTIALIVGIIGIVLPVIPASLCFLLTLLCYGISLKKCYLWIEKNIEKRSRSKTDG